MNCLLTDEDIKKQCKIHIKKHPMLDKILVLKHNGQDTNFVVTFSWPYGAIVQHRAWLDFFSESKTITVPRVVRLLEDGFYGILVTEKLGGQTLRQVMNGTPLSDEHADLIADTLQELRESVRPFENNKVTPLGQWTVQGHMFPEGETARVVDTVDEMSSFLTERFQRAVGNEVPLPPLEDGVFSYGNLSPDSIKLLSNGQLAFVDFSQSCMGPRWWDWYALAISCEDEGFVDPLLSALRRKGLIVDEEFGGVMDDLHSWYALYGTVADIQERDAIFSKTSHVITRSRPHSPVSMDNLPMLPHPPLA
ncbi:hypothetical protein BT96DRAFT_92546 [Gymnopus androsaceus JB14]|uniref:Aminoglycoside phosphotransferase domain-containing protein n=1 Tax=Gymnopus androsaceus JB14 TaxID=1447944 RepID=A0A6A4HGS4_9AGAR|nr:hypothetical protein BT96DRAFT_92546 [Gymnopus androsaceus JB14]